MTTLALSGSLADRFLPVSGVSRVVATVATVVLGSALLTLSAKIKVPFVPVPITLQTMMVPLLAAIVGLRLGLATLALYLAEGAAGLPVFTDTPERGIGLAYMLGSTGGYLAGFVVATALVGWAADRGWGRSLPKLLLAMIAGDIAIFALGFVWLSTLIGPEKAWLAGVVPFALGDVLKVTLAAFLAVALTRAVDAAR